MKAFCRRAARKTLYTTLVPTPAGTLTHEEDGLADSETVGVSSLLEAARALPLTADFEETAFTLLNCNVQGFLVKKDKLYAHLEQLNFPTYVGLTETWLDKRTEQPTLCGYTLVSRRDRHDGRGCGGVMLFARDNAANNVTFLGHSLEHERSWHLVHTNHGPLLLCLWYRAGNWPVPGETASIHSLDVEWEEYAH